MNNRMLDKVAKPFNVELPEAEGLDDMIGKILPAIRPHSEDLREQEFYLKRNWIEIRDDEDFHEVILHVFDEDGEYVRVVDGNIECGEWRIMNGKFVFGPSSCDAEVYELVFLDEEFFILTKHGNYRKFDRRFLVFIIEPLFKKLNWHEAMEFLFDKYRNTNSFFITITILLVLIIGIVLMLS
ncbi:MAG: hypothetical protein R2795_23715 [Saprospiraceae bacterium]